VRSMLAPANLCSTPAFWNRDTFRGVGACTHAVMGDRKQALAWLRNAILGGYKNVTEWVKSDPDLVSLHNDPEYEALVAETTKT